MEKPYETLSLHHSPGGFMINGVFTPAPENAPWVVFLDGKMGWYSDLNGRPDKLVLQLDVPAVREPDGS